MARSTRSYKNKTKISFKWTKELIIFLSVLSIAIILTIICLIPTTKEKFYSEFTNAAAANSATAIPEDHVFSYISYKELLKKKEAATKEDPLFILYGSSLDSTTVSNLYNLDAKAKEYGVTHIYIFNSQFAMETDQDDENDMAVIKTRAQEITGNEDTDLDLFTYNQLWVFNGEKGIESSTKLSTDIVFNSSDYMANVGGDNDNDPTFANAIQKCFSEYSPKGMAAQNNKSN